MKKVISILAVVFVLCGLFSMTTVAEEPTYTPGTPFAAYSNVAAEWTPVYVTTAANRTAADVAAMSINTSTAQASIPDNANTWEHIYCHAADATKYTASSAAYEIGFMFTAPLAGTYKLDFSGYCPDAQVAGANDDGMGVKVYDKTLNELESVVSSEGTADVATISKNYTLAAGEKMYVFFNLNVTPDNDRMMINTLTMTPMILPLSAATFAPADTTGLKVAAGASYEQFFNVEADPNAFALWKGFYVSKMNTIEALVPDTSNGATLKLPEALRTGDNQWMVMWEGMNNATSPIGEYIIGDYFTAPVDGTVRVDATFLYETAAPNGDGVYVTVYKNSIAEENIIIQKTLFDYETTSAASTENRGLAIKAENVDVEAGDVIIFVYDKNANYWSDNLKPLVKEVTYTAVDAPADIFNPDITKVAVDGQAITALEDLTVLELIEALGADAKNAAAYKANGIQIMNTSLVTAKDCASLVFFNDTKALAPIGTYSVTAVAELPSDEEEEQKPGGSPVTADASLVGLAVALLSACGTGLAVVNRKKK